jgi:hypothetical protein
MGRKAGQPKADHVWVAAKAQIGCARNYQVFYERAGSRLTGMTKTNLTFGPKQSI